MKIYQFITLLVLLTGVACKQKEKISLVSNEWQLESIKGNPTLTIPEEKPVLVFTDTLLVYGSGGCNRFSGDYRTEKNGGIQIALKIRSMAFCADMDFEDWYLKALEEMDHYTLEQGKMELRNQKGDRVLTYVPRDTSRQLLGVATDKHGCNAAAGYTWSEALKKCVRLFETGISLAPVNVSDSSLVAYVIFAPDSLKAELFIPGNVPHLLLERSDLPGGEYVWNEEDKTTYRLGRVNGKWALEKNQEILYQED